MTGIVFSLFPLVFWGMSDYVSSRLSKGLHPAAINFFFASAILPPTVLFCSFFGFPTITLASLRDFCFASLLLTGWYVSMLLAFRRGLAGVVAPIANAYAVVTLFIAVFFLDEATSVLQVSAVFLVVLGIFMLSYKKKLKGQKFKANSSILFALLAMTLFGIGFAAFDVVAKGEWFENAIQFQFAGFIVALALSLAWDRRGIIKNTVAVFKLRLAYLGAIVASTGTIGLFIALENTDNVAIPATIAAASPLVTVALARHYDNEKLLPRQYIAAVVIVLGIVLLGLRS